MEACPMQYDQRSGALVGPNSRLPPSRTSGRVDRWRTRGRDCWSGSARHPEQKSRAGGRTGEFAVATAERGAVVLRPDH
jgi:hypothetical protein